ncbi:MAG: hypothetical protein E7218_02805 [Anaerofustis stercorihominis]|nr:hypothetical protein [Anaerofustis stercorihominis]
MDIKHYTYDEIRAMVHSSSPVSEEFLEHIIICDECAEMFFEISREISVSPPRTVTVNIMEKIAMMKQRIKVFMYNLKVAFGVCMALFMLFTLPINEETADIIRKNDENVNTISEKYEEIREDFDKFVDIYMKGINNDDKTEK